jgi:hypothetical protein
LLEGKPASDFWKTQNLNAPPEEKAAKGKEAARGA